MCSAVQRKLDRKALAGVHRCVWIGLYTCEFYVVHTLYYPCQTFASIPIRAYRRGAGYVVPPAPVNGVPSRPTLAQQAVPRDTVPAVLGWDQAGPQVPTRRRLLDHHPAFTPLLNAFAPQPVRVAPDDRDDTRLSSRSCPPSAPRGDALLERGGDRPRDPLCGLLPCGLFCPYQKTPLRGTMASTPRGPRGPPQPIAPPSARPEQPAAPQADPAQNPLAYVVALMEYFSKRMSSMEQNVLAGSAAPKREAPWIRRNQTVLPLFPTGRLGCDRAVRDEGRPCSHPAACPFRTLSSPCCLSSSELRPFRHQG
jgi:hypothetical protein